MVSSENEAMSEDSLSNSPHIDSSDDDDYTDEIRQLELKVIFLYTVAIILKIY